MQVLIAIDQLLNAVFGGWADETFSARCWREGKTCRVWDALRALVDTILYFDDQHCFTSYLSECERRQLPRGYRHCAEVE